MKTIIGLSLSLVACSLGFGCLSAAAQPASDQRRPGMGAAAQPSDRTIAPSPALPIICGDLIRANDMPDGMMRRGPDASDGARDVKSIPRRQPIIDRPDTVSGGCKRRRVNTPDELEATLRSDFVGCVIVPRDKYFNLTGRTNIPIKSGVSLIGERGVLCSRPTLYTDTESTETYALFTISGNDVRVLGLHIRGPAHGSRAPIGPSRAYVHGILVTADADKMLGRRIVITDNEFDEWPGSGVEVKSTHDVTRLDQYRSEWARLTRGDAAFIQITRNFMHHNAPKGGGYGVTVGGGAYALVEGNVFDFNRHAVASGGSAHSGYIARHNYVLEGGFLYDSYYGQHFDVHGTEKEGYGGMAGEYYEIAFNTIRGEQIYHGGISTRPAFELRGTPTDAAYFYGNVLVHNDLDTAVALKRFSWDPQIGEDHDAFNFHAYGNSFDTNRANQLATGDFDGDGRTDVFITTGTAWFLSRAGFEPWEFLRASTKLVGELGFADIDNDRVTDVLLREASGNVIYLKRGRADPLLLTASPVAMKDIRFGDFDGDGLADMFYTRKGQWQVWYGKARAWVHTGASSFSIGSLLFGEFDEVRGTDIAAITAINGVAAWAYSSGSTGPWTKLNDRLASSFADAVTADFDGDGKTDIAFSDEWRQSWYMSPGGRFPFRALREADGMIPYPALKSLLVGHFDGDARAEVLSYYSPIAKHGGPLANHFVIWREGIRADFSEHSREAMR